MLGLTPPRHSRTLLAPTVRFAQRAVIRGPRGERVTSTPKEAFVANKGTPQIGCAIRSPERHGRKRNAPL